MYNLEKFVDDHSEENLHQARVSGRKLESLFEAFGNLSESEYNSYYKQVTDIIKLLSVSREADVCISMTNEYLKQIKVGSILNQNFLNHLIRNSKLNRKRIFKNTKIADFLSGREVFDKFLRVDMFKDNAFLTIKDARNHSLVIIPKLYDKVFEYEDVVINKPAEKKVLHKMRLKAKPLRYLVEFANETFDCNLTDIHFQIKEFVEQAGLIHDIDMLIVRVDKYSSLLNNLKGKDKILSKDKTLKVFVRYLNAKRKEEYEAFRNMIFKMESNKLKEKLLMELSKPAKLSKT